MHIHIEQSARDYIAAKSTEQAIIITIKERVASC